MKNKKRIYQGYNRKQLKEVVTGLQTEVKSLITQLEKERVKHNSINLDLVQAHYGDVLRYKRELDKVKNEVAVTKNRNEKLVEQLEHFTKELLYVNDENTKLSVENNKLKQRGLFERIFNRG